MPQLALFLPVKLASQCASVKNAAKHGGLEQIVDLPCMMVRMSNQPDHFEHQTLGVKLSYPKPRALGEVMLALLIDLAYIPQPNNALFVFKASGQPAAPNILRTLSEAWPNPAPFGGRMLPTAC